MTDMQDASVVVKQNTHDTLFQHQRHKCTVDTTFNIDDVTNELNNLMSLLPHNGHKYNNTDVYDNKQLLTDVASYSQQCYDLCSNPTQYYQNINIVGQKYAPHLLQQLEIIRVKEWRTLNKVLKIKTKAAYTSYSTYNITSLMAKAWQHRPSKKTTPLELYTQQCSNLLTLISPTYYISVEVVGYNYPLAMLKQLVICKDKEWKILCDMHAKCISALGSINYTISSITRLVTHTPFILPNKHNDHNYIMQQLEQRREEFVFGAGTAAATRMFLAELTTERLNDFNNCIMQMLHVMRKKIEIRNPTQLLKDKVQVIIKKGKAINDKENICDVKIINFGIIGKVINVKYKNINFTDKERLNYGDLMLNLSTITLLLLYEYTQDMHHVIAAVQTTRK